MSLLDSQGEFTVRYFEPEHGRDPVIAKLPGIHDDLRGKLVRLTADPAKVQVFSNGKSLLYR